jgi:hypothetical protein
MRVETDFSRSCIASTYDASTAPAATRSCPASAIASSRVRALPPRTIESGDSTLAAATAGSSATAAPPEEEPSISTISS